MSKNNLPCHALWRYSPLALAVMFTCHEVAVVHAEAPSPVASQRVVEAIEAATASGQALSTSPQTPADADADVALRYINPRAGTLSAESLERGQAVRAFATQNHEIMQGPASAQYLQNRNLQAVSTFPAQLEVKQPASWKPSPFMPIKSQDLSCFYGVPSYRTPLKYDRAKTAVNISADDLEGQLNAEVRYRGRVMITQGDTALASDEAWYDGQKRQVVSSGNVVYAAPGFTVTTDQPVTTELDTHKSTFLGGRYQVNGSVASGRLGKIENLQDESTTEIEEATFTGCPEGDNSWHFSATDITIDRRESFGDARNAVLWLGKVPVFYTPYINFPITDRRRSGLLYPSASYSSTDLFVYSQPIYFNLAPNYDYTMTPSIYGRRGFKLDNEFRYLPWENVRGSIEFDFLPHDKLAAINNDEGSQHRWMLRWRHDMSFLDDDLTFNFDYGRIRHGDYNYNSDFGTLREEDNHVLQSFRMAYDRPNYNMSLEVREYQSLLPQSAFSFRPFSMLPQFRASAYETVGGFLLSADAEITHFRSNHDARDMQGYKATRLHFEPTVQYHIFDARGTTLNARVKGFLTHYEQGDENRLTRVRSTLGFDHLDRSVNRALYLLELRGKTTLERKVLDLRHTQTLEPEIQYQYIPYRNQNNIALYDTTNRVSDYYTNFSYQRYTGLDRIADTNTLTMGLTSRLLDAHDREVLRLSLSQAYSFDPTRTRLSAHDKISRYPRSPITASFDAHPFEGFNLHTAASYDNEKGKLDRYEGMLTYRHGGYLAQASYRFHRNGNFTDTGRVIDLKQLGLTTLIPVTDHWKFIGAWYRDLEDKRNIDLKFGLKYEECCWSVAFIGEQYTRMNWNKIERERKRVFGIQFELKGVASVNMKGSSAFSPSTELIPYFDQTSLNR